MTTVPVPDDRAEAPLFADGIGERVVVADGATGELLQILRLRPTLTAVPSFEFALRERAARLANFRHAYYARVRRIDRVPPPGTGLAIVSDHVEGTRLSDVLRVAYERGLQLDVNTALCLIRQLVAAVTVLHENAREVAHGLIAPERLLVTPHARLVIVEHVLAAAIEQLQFGRDRLWQEFRIALPPSAGLPRFDHRADVTGMGLVALALLLGRPLGADEFPHKVAELLQHARERTALGDEQPLSTPLRAWLARALQLDPRRAFASGPEALAGLEEVVGDDSVYVSAPVALETFLSRYTAALLEPPPEMPDISTQFATPVVDAALQYEQPRSASTPFESAVASERAREPEPRFTDFHVELERDAALAKESPVRHVTQHIAPVWRDTPSRLVRETPVRKPPEAQPSRQSGEKTDRTSANPPRFAQDPHDNRDRMSGNPRFTEDPHDALAAPWIEPVGGAAPPPFAPTPDPASGFASHPKVDVLAPAAGITAVTARDIEELISTKDLTPDVPSELAAAVTETRPLTVSAKRRSGSPWGRTAALLAVIVALAGAGVFGSRYYSGGTATAGGAMGTLIVQSRPAGVQVVIDGVDRGLTPARLSVTPGAHILELRGRGIPRVMPITVAAGTQISQYVEFADNQAVGQLTVQSQPPGARVIVDGTDRGVAPLTIADLAPGDHEVIFQSDAGNVRHVVNVQAGATASLVAPLTGAAAGSGWVTIKAPFTIEIREQGQMLGTSESERVMMPAGRHQLELVNDTLGYRATRVVQVPAGKVVRVPVDLPQGVVNLNATPWAEVWIDGVRVGDTPIGNLAVAIGPHEVVFRHPQLGEKRHAISVTLGDPVRVSMDMR